MLKQWGPAVLAAFFGAASCAHRPPMIVRSAPASCHRVVPDATTPITWITPNDPRDAGRLGRWCQTVGPAVAVSPAIDARPGPVSDRFAVVSWNVHVGGGDIEGLVNRLRLGEFTGGVPTADFALLLQEAYRDGDDVPPLTADDGSVPRAIVERAPDGTRRDIRAVAERAGLHLFYAPAMRNGRLADSEDRGAAILSTAPLSDLQVIELPFERQRRVALAATVGGTTAAGRSWELRLADVQVDTSLALTRGGPFAARRRQAEALVEALAVAGTHAATPTIVGGDFNTWLGPREPALAVMRRAFTDTPGLAEAGSSRSMSTWRGPLGMHAALDYVFVKGVSPAIVARRLSSRFGSDHYPLLTLLQFERGTIRG